MSIAVPVWKKVYENLWLYQVFEVTHPYLRRYDSQRGPDNNSGAYLFIPSGPATDYRPEPFPEIVVTEGMYKATLYTALNSPKAADLVVAVSILRNIT